MRAIISHEARKRALPETFFARLIWKESLFDATAVSPKGAQGIAQFMPGTARDRGLADPFHAGDALTASAHLLADLRDRFGNLGLAAAAYNAGEDRVQAWIKGGPGLPAETLDYVFFITGRPAADWRPGGVRISMPTVVPSDDFTEECIELASRRAKPRPRKSARVNGNRGASSLPPAVRKPSPPWLPSAGSALAIHPCSPA